MSELKLPKEDRSIEVYSLSGTPVAVEKRSAADFNRIAFAAAHVVADPLADNDPWLNPAIDWDAIRVAACIPETGIELIPEDTYLLEAGFERLHGVDFRKGCYVGQEVTARMKHKTELRKGLVSVGIEGAAPVGTPILMADGREAGVLFTRSGPRAIAHMRFDRMGDGLVAGDARIIP